MGNFSGGPAVAPGAPLPGTVNNAYAGAVNNASTAGMGIAPAGGTYMDMASVDPRMVSGGSSARRLRPYMNPFTRQVTNTTMDRLRREEQIGRRDIADEAGAAGALGGSRWNVENALNTEGFRRQRAETLAGLNMANFGQAQNARQADLDRKLRAGMSNQGVEAGQQAGGAAGLSGLGQFGTSEMGNLANMGFGWGADLERRGLASGGMQQALNQAILDSIKGQVGGFTGQGNVGLDTLIKGLPSIGGAGKTETSNNPGIMGILGGLTSILGIL